MKIGCKIDEFLSPGSAIDHEVGYLLLGLLGWIDWDEDELAVSLGILGEELLCDLDKLVTDELGWMELAEYDCLGGVEGLSVLLDIRDYLDSLLQGLADHADSYLSLCEAEGGEERGKTDCLLEQVP